MTKPLTSFSDHGSAVSAATEPTSAALAPSTAIHAGTANQNSPIGMPCPT